MRMDIYNHKAPREGTSPLTPESPVNEAATSTRTAVKASVLVSYGKMVAMRTVNTIAQDLRASGNEELATTLGNAVSGATLVMSAVATKGLSLIPAAIGAASSEFTQIRGRQRANRNAEFEREQMGQRLSHEQRSAYYE